MQLSIITTLYNSAPHIEEFYDRIVKVASSIVNNFEIIFVNDGSPDNSLKLALQIHAMDNRVSVIDLSRNFGHHKAIMTGLAHAAGNYVFLIDCDLEEEPGLLEQFWTNMHTSTTQPGKDEIDVVYGVQNSRKGGSLERWGGTVAWYLFDLLLTPKVPHNQSTVRLMRKSYVEALILHTEHKTAIGGLWVLTGFNQIPVSFDKGTRGNTSYSFRKRLNAFFESITSFSEAPLYAVFYLGVVIILLSFLVGIYLIIGKLLGTVMSGWTSLMVTIWLLGGMTVMSIGVVGLYVSRIFIETKQRPFTIIRKVHSHDK